MRDYLVRRQRRSTARAADRGRARQAGRQHPMLGPLESCWIETQPDTIDEPTGDEEGRHTFLRPPPQPIDSGFYERSLR